METAQEIVEALAPQAAQLASALRGRLDAASAETVPTQASPGVPEEDEDYRRLRAALGHDPVPIDVLAQRTGLTVDTLSSMLILMELDGRVAAAHGRYALRR